MIQLGECDHILIMIHILVVVNLKALKDLRIEMPFSEISPV